MAGPSAAVTDRISGRVVSRRLVRSVVGAKFISEKARQQKPRREAPLSNGFVIAGNDGRTAPPYWNEASADAGSQNAHEYETR